MDQKHQIKNHHLKIYVLSFFKTKLLCKSNCLKYLKRYSTAAATSYFVKFYFVNWNTFQKYDF